MLKDVTGIRGESDAEAETAQRANAELQAALLMHIDKGGALAEIATAPAGEIKWECAWHQQYFQCRAWYGDNHVPTTIQPDPLPNTHGVCLDCFNKLKAQIV